MARSIIHVLCFLTDVTAQKRLHSCNLTAQLPTKITCLLNIFRVEENQYWLNYFHTFFGCVFSLNLFEYIWSPGCIALWCRKRLMCVAVQHVKLFFVIINLDCIQIANLCWAKSKWMKLKWLFRLENFSTIFNRKVLKGFNISTLKRSSQKRLFCKRFRCVIQINSIINNLIKLKFLSSLVSILGIQSSTTNKFLSSFVFKT